MARSKRSTGLKDPKYLAWLREQQCVVCKFSVVSVSSNAATMEITIQLAEQTTVTEAAHCGDRGLSQKCSDREALPLCGEHHRTGKFSHHILGKRFWQHHGLDKDVLIAEYNRLFEER